MNPRTLVSVLNWNSTDDTLECCRSLIHSGIDLVDILVIDNGSNSSAYQNLQDGLEGIRIIRNSVNQGFAGGHNQAIELALALDYQWIWLVNNDCVVEPGQLAKLLEAVESDARVGIISPVIVLPEAYCIDTSIPKYQFAGSWFDWKNLQCIRPTQIGDYLKEETHDGREIWVTGTALLLRVSMLKEIGGLENRYFAYYEDNEICIRAQRKNYRVKLVPDVFVEHRSFARPFERGPHYFYLISRNGLRFWLDNTPSTFKINVARRLLFRSVLEAKQLFSNGYPLQANAVMLGWLHGWIGRLGPFPQRWHENRFFLFLLGLIPYRIALFFSK